ncbi:DUF1697 domain-containing protein [Demequina mangrovi]|uniref:Uncharacterized conserved protein, DUF1697 family n=1 Tax=Demequina mangrovi TaxID=1043493 RepID=A0A1H7AVW7_9MICO|nr:DUF1697 domain-containing protein [Demequina mangrovi]SEJ69751.1 Uncharacterized conserved protein, DUF1697 family [Demequina mangrovi]
MPAATHVALIRGINVGGRNAVPMARLRSALEERGVTARTYIQSGNVLVETPDSDEAQVGALVEQVLAEEFDVVTVVVAVAAERLRAAVDDAPSGFGTEPDVYHSDVAFLRAGVDVGEAFGAFAMREGVDAGWAGKGVIYFRRLSAQRTRSRMNKVMSTPFYKDMTIRNWATTTTLVAMLDG